MIQYSTWMSLPLSTRMKIAEALGIKKLRSTHVANDQVLDDGYNVKDVEEAIKVAPMQNYLNSTETDVTILFQNLIDTVEGREVKKEEPVLVVPKEVYEMAKEAPSVLVDKPLKKKPGRKPKVK